MEPKIIIIANLGPLPWVVWVPLQLFAFGLVAAVILRWLAWEENDEILWMRIGWSIGAAVAVAGLLLAICACVWLVRPWA